MRTKIITIAISWGRPRARGPQTRILAFGDNAPEIEENAVASVRTRFRPGARLRIYHDYVIAPVDQGDRSVTEKEQETRGTGDGVPRRYYASVTVYEVPE